MGGQPKALLPFGGEALIERQIKELRKACEEIIVVSQDVRISAYLSDYDGVTIVQDLIQESGPLGGMHAAFNSSSCDIHWVVGSDMPFLSSRAALFMVEIKQAAGSAAVVPHINGKTHPLHGVYSRGCLASLQQLLEERRLRVMEFLREIQAIELKEEAFAERGIPIRFVVNANTPEDYERALSIYKEQIKQNRSHHPPCSAATRAGSGSLENGDDHRS